MRSTLKILSVTNMLAYSWAENILVKSLIYNPHISGATTLAITTYSKMTINITTLSIIIKLTLFKVWLCWVQGILTEGEGLVRLTSLCWLVKISWILQRNIFFLLCKTSYFNQEVNCIKASPSVGVLCWMTCWVSTGWVLLCCKLSFWVQLCWKSSCWVSLCWVSLWPGLGTWLAGWDERNFIVQFFLDTDIIN